MGKPSKQRRIERRQASRLFAQWIEAELSSPCTTCAFRDPEAFVADPEIPRKLLRCLEHGEVFWCHDGLTTVDSRYQLPHRSDGTINTSPLKICAGFVGFYAKLRRRPLEEQRAAIAALQRRMVGRWLSSDGAAARRFAEICERDAGAMVKALDLLADSHERARKAEGL